MIHEIDDIEQELHRISDRPSLAAAPPMLCAFDVAVKGDVAEYQARIKSVLHITLELALSESLDGDDLSVSRIPEWFAGVSGDTSLPVPDSARSGAQRYISAIDGGAWKLQEWLYQFDPDSEFRGWAWWDLTPLGDGRVRIWVDTWGESFFACDELRWLAFTSGADEISGPTLARTDEWASSINP
ncbi:hypothetical protein [Streptomyces sp. NPDC088350]|uniref:hypothetical protein n=1 Tax=Streptomyces sp. NPDC088350 TaxID=3365854 RepID=UPI00380DF53F